MGDLTDEAWQLPSALGGRVVDVSHGAAIVCRPSCMTAFDSRICPDSFSLPCLSCPVSNAVFAPSHHSPRVLISDFGSSALLQDNWLRRRSGHTGTMEFMAPEALRLDPRTGDLQELTSKADMWSLGELAICSPSAFESSTGELQLTTLPLFPNPACGAQLNPRTGMILHLLLFFRLPYTQVDDVELLRKEMLAYEGLGSGTGTGTG